MSVLVTGGAGYIGSHVCLRLLETGNDVVVVDNLCTSKKQSIERVEKLTGKPIKFYNINLLDNDALLSVFENESIDSVIHFAGLKAVGESVSVPLKYYHNNITGAISLLSAMQQSNVKNIVFSSSAAVYGIVNTVPISEDFPLSSTNAYGRTKIFIEEILRDLYTSDNSYNIAILRYFNAVGAHESGQIGEDPYGVPNNVFPNIAHAAVGRLPKFTINGTDHETPDGTCIRDYIHVMDLAEGHIKSLTKLKQNPGIVTYNLGTGKGYSVLEIFSEFQKACGKKIPSVISGRRPGDVAKCYADPQKAYNELGFLAERTIAQMCEDIWRWQSQNPKGYE